MKMKKLKFSWLNFEKIPNDAHGIYYIYSKTVLIYIGKAEKQSIKTRIIQHYSRCHNEKLKAWINSTHKLWFAFEIITNLKSIDARERKRIKKYHHLLTIN